MKRIAIIGSRSIQLSKDVEDFVRMLDREVVLITGGAEGVDTTVECTARELDIPCVIIRPDYNRYGKRAPLKRNLLIALLCDEMVAFWDGESRGTMQAIGCAERYGKPTIVRQSK